MDDQQNNGEQKQSFTRPERKTSGGQGFQPVNMNQSNYPQDYKQMMGMMNQSPFSMNQNSNNTQFCKYFLKINENYTETTEETINYYQQEACRLYIANVVLSNQVNQMMTEKTELQKKIEKLEKNNKENSQLFLMNDDKRKRHRRGAKDIERHYRCPVEECQKSYGSEGSLAQHIKLKHPDFYNTISSNISQTLSKLKQDEDGKHLDGDKNNEEDYSSSIDQNTGQNNSHPQESLQKVDEIQLGSEKL